LPSLPGRLEIMPNFQGPCNDSGGKGRNDVGTRTDRFQRLDLIREAAR
jgi:hypothetical protein